MSRGLTHTHKHTHTQDNYSNPRACAPRVNYTSPVSLDFLWNAVVVVTLTYKKHTKDIGFSEMMAVVILISWLLLVSQRALAERVYIVDANLPARSCPGNKTECSLMYYATHHEEYFKEDNTTFRFRPGNHKLEKSTCVFMSNVSNLLLYGSDVDVVTVECRGQDSGGFMFYNVTNLTMKDMSFMNCSKGGYPWSYDSMAIYIQHVFNVRIDSIRIAKTPGIGLYLKDPYGNVSISNTSIDYSHSTSSSKGINFVYYCSYDCKNQTVVMITVMDSFFTNGTNTFDPVAPSGGVVINIYGSATITIVFNRVVLSGNRGMTGGNAVINFSSWSSSWTASIFILNSWILNGIGNSGGGLFVTAIAGGEDGHKSISENKTMLLTVRNTAFENNTAYYNGGAIYLRLQQNSQSDIGAISFENNCTFINNNLVYHNILHGGAAVHIVTFTLPHYEQHNSIFFEVEFVNYKFLENSVTNSNTSVLKTGALYAESAQSITLRDCSFVRNNCTGIVGIDTNFLLHGEIEIMGNNASKGGGIFLCSSSMMHIRNGTQIRIFGNHAHLSGGGIFVDGDWAVLFLPSGQCLSQYYYTQENTSPSSEQYCRGWECRLRRSGGLVHPLC